MVRIIEFQVKQNQDGKDFCTLTLQGKMEMVESKTTGDFYMTARKTSIPTTFSEEYCKSLIGTELPGNISKVESVPYEYTIKETGEVVTLNHKFIYSPNEDMESVPSEVIKEKESPVKADVSSFSSNGVLEPA